MKSRKTLIIVILLVSILILSLFIFYFLSFRLVSTNAKGKVIAASTSQLIFEFNKQIDDNLDLSSNNVVINKPAKVEPVSVENNKIIFQINNEFPEKDVNIKIKLIKSIGGDEINNLDKSFSFEYINFNDLSKTEQKRQIDESSSSEDRYPVIKDLPIITEKFNIDYQLPVSGADKLIITIDVIGVSDSMELDQDVIDYTRQIRKEAIKSLQDKGYNTEDYTLDYAETLPEDLS